MDRKYRKVDTVHVHQSQMDGPVLATFKDKPYTWNGYDNYQYQGRMYKGFIDLYTLRVYILLDQPLNYHNLAPQPAKETS